MSLLASTARQLCPRVAISITADSISGVLDLFPLAPQIPQDVRTDIFRLESDSLSILQSLRTVLETFGPLQQTRSR